MRHIHFTGSTAVGSIIAHEAADSLTTTLELGGNDAAIVLDDVFDDPAIFPRIVADAFGGAGQACVALKRRYVPKSRFADTVDALAAVLDRTVVGDGLDDATTMGPLHTATGRDRVLGMADARSMGAQICEFGTLAADPDKGYFLRPTLASGVGSNDRVVREEQFGPVLPVIGYESADYAVAMPNDSEYGLSGSVWSKDPERAVAVARRFESGMTLINTHGGAESMAACRGVE